MKDIFSTLLVGFGGFLMGASAGIALSSPNCYDCDKSVEYWEEGDDGLPTDKYISIEEYDSVLEELYKYKTKDYISNEYGKSISEEEFNEIDDVDKDPKPITVNNLMDISKLDADDEEDTDDDVEEEDAEDGYSSSPYLDEDGNLVRMTSEGVVEVEEPQVISYEDFANTCRDFSKSTLTYYEEDDILSTELSEVIHNVDELIGSDTLDNFGVDSYNDDIVYARNTKIASDFEIVRKKGSYQEEVLGFSNDDEINQAYRDARKAFGMDEG